MLPRVANTAWDDGGERDISMPFPQGFEYDERKRLLTLASRGLDFGDAGRVFSGRVLSRFDLRTDDGEVRVVTAGKLSGRHVIIVWTTRGRNRRIISMRHANERERRQLRKYLD